MREQKHGPETSPHLTTVHRVVREKKTSARASSPTRPGLLREKMTTQYWGTQVSSGSAFFPETLSQKKVNTGKDSLKFLWMDQKEQLFIWASSLSISLPSELASSFTRQRQTRVKALRGILKSSVTIRTAIVPLQWMYCMFVCGFFFVLTTLEGLRLESRFIFS